MKILSIKELPYIDSVQASVFIMGVILVLIAITLAIILCQTEKDFYPTARIFPLLIIVVGIAVYILLSRIL